MINTHLKTLGRQLSRYGLVGLLATSAHYLLMALLVKTGFSPLVSTTSGALLGAFVAYAANRRWTFEAAHTRTRMIRFLLVAGFGLVLNGALLVTIQSLLIESLPIAQVLTTGLVFLATFFINLKWSFS
jgi:putative flippase GtrA